MILRSTVFAIALFVGFLEVAAAQTAESGGTRLKSSDTTVSPQAIGWNIVRVAACTATTSGLILIGNDNSQWFMFDINFIATLTPACQTNHFVGFFVVNAAGTVTQVFVWPF